jgi:4-hydroxybenzoate polyprenyltransferase
MEQFSDTAGRNVRHSGATPLRNSSQAKPKPKGPFDRGPSRDGKASLRAAESIVGRKRSGVGTVLALFRVPQYAKNAFVFIPAFFGSAIATPFVLQHLLLLFASFCLASSAVYMFNDIMDREADRMHPIKRLRPIASGAVSVRIAAILSTVCLLFSTALASIHPMDGILPCILLYAGLNVFYSLFAKHRAILDIVLLALGFVIRVFAGTLAAGLPPSPWLFLMVFLLATFLALGKRWHDAELERQSPGARGVRKALSGYNREFMMSLMALFACMNTICYVIYSVAASGPDINHGLYFFTTSLWVIVGNMRYLQIVFVENSGHSPTDVLLHDRCVQGVLLAWCIHVTILLYFATP